MVLVAQLEPGLRLRIPLICLNLVPPRLCDAFLASVPEYDTERRAAAAFDRRAPHYTPRNTQPGLYKVVRELRRKRAKVSITVVF
jgi:hypothetical protein